METPTQTPACKVCGTGHPLPADATFCPNCGRPAPGTLSTRVAVAWTAAIAVVLLVLLGVGVTLIAVGRQPHRPVPVATARIAPTPSPMTGLPATRPAAPPAVAAADPPVADPTDPPAPPVVDPAIPVRAGDSDLNADPLSAYAGGPSSDRLTVGGLRIGLPVSTVPAARTAEVEADHLRDTAGNLCAVTDGRVTEVHVRDPDVLNRMPIDSTNSLFARFGQPADAYHGDGDTTFLYPDRGIHVRWDDVAGRITELVLVRPGKS